MKIYLSILDLVYGLIVDAFWLSPVGVYLENSQFYFLSQLIFIIIYYVFNSFSR